MWVGDIRSWNEGEICRINNISTYQTAYTNFQHIFTYVLVNQTCDDMYIQSEDSHATNDFQDRINDISHCIVFIIIFCFDIHNIVTL